MKILILGGFLGSGKTTALMQLARYLAAHAEPECENKVVILENEVGEVGIDDAYLRGGGFRVDNLFSGCACCTVSGELVSAAVRIKKELDPQWLIIETTGIAYPKSMQENLKNAVGYDSRIVVLVDAARWRRLLIPMNNLLRGQIIGSNAVLINKTDMVDEDALCKIERDILLIEPKSVIKRISALSPVAPEVWQAVAGTGESK